MIDRRSASFFSILSLISGVLFLGVALAHHFRYIDGANNLGAVIFYFIVGFCLAALAFFLKKRYSL
ncbi:MAG: hypothetical protein PHC43_01065 [Candidatus Marinimicrobia bacterium]|jgi:hypothetical protein|nr:hypothetical protein [Candidatus Neomarinimicrobiota bacterium]MDD5229899.1 hypothetical protein [Candidatus Neomarinimicrobiota bacterium]MDD5539870.1 hypothetical protein [Candidatus Neomarinimicrobiota bacterium]